MICSVCIATYKRKHLLRNLLKSIFNQNLPNGVEMQIVVVDNDKDKSAKDVIKEFPANDKIRIEYYSQPLKNISLTRNVAVKNSRGDFLLFVDDDETADPNLVKEHLNAMEKFNADGVFGRVIPKFPSITPGWIKRNNYFNKKSSPTGKPAISLATSNCFIKSSLLKIKPLPFDPKYGLTGGEDTHLFHGLRKEGANFVSCREAIVNDIIPEERIRIKWLIKKSYQTGNTATRRMIELAEYKFLKRIFLLFKAIIFLVISFLFFLICFPVIDYRIKWMLKTISNLGHITAALGYNYFGYK